MHHFLNPQISSLPAIVQDLLSYNVLQRRKFLFDAFGEGLQEFQLVAALHAFPELLKPLFVASPASSAQDLKKIVRFEQQLVGSRKRIAEYLMRFIDSLSETGECVYLD